MLDPKLITPGARIRLTRGAKVFSKNPSRPEHEVTRPYWIVVDHVIPGGPVVWIGNGGYYFHAEPASFDEIESY